jgi:hypothetical protein
MIDLRMQRSLWGVEPGRGAARRRSLAGIDEGLSTARSVSADTWLGALPWRRAMVL